MKTLTAIVVGYGMRGRTYTNYAIDFPEKVKIVGVAEPVESKREEARQRFSISDDMVFDNWEEVAKLPKSADFIILATQDNMHYEPSLAFIEKGYDILLEKPMAPTAKECKEIALAAEKKGVKVLVCHVLRYTQFFCTLKDMLDNGDIGEIMSIVHMENVGNEHQSHSFVRGNWRNSKESAPMILAKSCHDTDLIQWLIGKECKKVQSFGSLTHFTQENKPKGAPSYCMEGCPYGEECFYNAIKLYCESDSAWFRNIAANKRNPTDEEVNEAIRTGPYGRCVYECDNDVVDHQVVNMEFDGGCTVSFTMNAFNKGGRFIRIFGTKGEIYGDMRKGTLEVYSFKTQTINPIDIHNLGDSITSGHGGGDTGIMGALVKYFTGKDTGNSVSGPYRSYMNHLISFAAEQSRVNGTIIDLEDFAQSL